METDQSKSPGWAFRLETQEEPMLQFRPKGRPLAELPFDWRRSVICSHQAFNWLGEAHPYHGGQPALLQVHQSECQSHPKMPSEAHSES